MKFSNKKVLISYGWCRNSWAVLRNLSRNGLEVFVGDSNPINMCRFSRYTKGNLIYPSFHSHPDEFISSIINFIIKNNIGTFIPIHEEVMLVAKYIKKFPKNVKIPISEFSKIYSLHNKRLSCKMAHDLNIPLPKTYFPKNLYDIKNIASLIDYPVVIKLTNSNSAKGVWFESNGSSISNKINFIIENYPLDEIPIIQENVPGVMYAVSILAEEGRIINQFVRRNIRGKETFGGTCTKCESIKAPFLVKEVKKIITYLKYTGVLMVEFKVDELKGRYWFIEANPRYWGTISFDVDCGIEIPFNHFCLANSLPYRKINKYKEGLISRWIIGDCIGLVNRLNARNSNIKEITKYLNFDEDFYMDLKFDDPLVFLMQAFYYFYKFIRFKSTNPIEKNMIS